MTLLDIKNHLYAHFLVKSTFSIKEDLGSVGLGAAYDNAVKDSILADKKEPMFRAALAELEKADMILCLDSAADTYVLKQPLTAAPQAVVIAPLTAHRVAELINDFGRRTGFLTNPHQYATNKFAITDGDIGAIVQICYTLSDEVDHLIEMLEDGPPTGDDDDAGGYDKATHPFGN